MGKKRLLNELRNAMWSPPKRRHTDWASRELRALGQGEEEVPPGALVEKAVARILLNGMPASYAALCSEIRAHRCADWPQIEGRLINYE